MSTTRHELNIVLVGDAMVGKTSFLRKHQEGKPPGDYNPTLEAESSPLPWNTTAGYLDVTVWDIPSNRDFSSATKEALKNADAALIFFDVCEQATLDNVPWWAQELRSATSDSLPIVVCGNKVDKVEGDRYSKPNTVQDEYYDISVVKCFNFEEPWLGLFRQLLKAPEIELTGPICAMPITDESQAARWREEMREAASQPIPDGSDSDS